MAKIYHNGEYVNGGPTAKTINTYYVEISESPIYSPIHIPENYYHSDGGGTGLREHTLVIRNVSSDILYIRNINVITADGNLSGYETKSIVPSYRDLYSYAISSDNMYIKNPHGSLFQSTIRLEPHTSHEFFFNRNSYIQMDRFYEHCISAKGSNIIQIYSEQGLRLEREYPFILSGYINGVQRAQFTVGTIAFTQISDSVSIVINQESIIGNSRLDNIDIYNVNGEKVTGDAAHNALINAFALKFYPSNSSPGDYANYALHLFT